MWLNPPRDTERSAVSLAFARLMEKRHPGVIFVEFPAKELRRSGAGPVAREEFGVPGRDVVAHADQENPLI